MNRPDDNPAIIQVGATITGLQQDLILGITTYVNGAEMNPVQIDTTQAATQSRPSATATRRYHTPPAI